MQKIAVLTSGGDAPGMNAAIRAVVRSACEYGMTPYGVIGGYKGLVDGEFQELGERSVGGILQLGGTFLGSARCLEFKEKLGQEKAIKNLKAHGVEALIVIGGNGSQTGAHALHRLGLPVVGVASTIDNDLLGTDITIGCDTAISIALEAIDRLKVTASSHKRGIVVEVMGRDCGYIGLMAGLAGGAEKILIPEVESTLEEVVDCIANAHKKGKRHALIVVSEGAKCNAEKLKSHFKDKRLELGYDMRFTILGHTQRGGAPTYFDRMLATRFGHEAVKALYEKDVGVLIGHVDGRLARTPLAEIIGKTKGPDLELIELARVMAR